MKSFLDLQPVRHMAGRVRLPGSKSISNRALLLAALSDGATRLTGLLDADDVARMLGALQALGIAIEHHGPGECTVHGCGGEFPVRQARLDLGNAGTAFRPLTAALAFSRGSYVLSGTPRMHERPIGDLVDGLRALGARIEYRANPGYPPLEIEPASAPANGGGDAATGHVRVRGDVSSQFLSALLMALPLIQSSMRRTVHVEVAGVLVSQPYVAITLSLMRRFGVVVEHQAWRSFRVAGDAAYRSPGVLPVEGDASSASYFLAAGAIAGGPVRVEGVGRDSIQGDVRFSETLAAMGARVSVGDDWIEVAANGPLSAFDADFNDLPDAAMTAAATALFADGTSTLRNIGSWRVKETDRIDAMARELSKVGAHIEQGPDWLRVTPPQSFRPATIDTYDDHRMAMSLSLAALGGVALRINDPDCVRKTFPEYFEQFLSLADR